MLSRNLQRMNISKWFRRKKRTDEELREEEESRLRAAEETRRAEQDSERSRQQSKVPSNRGRADESDEEDESHGEFEHALETAARSGFFPRDFPHPCGRLWALWKFARLFAQFPETSSGCPRTDVLGSARRSQEPPLPVVGPQPTSP